MNASISNPKIVKEQMAKQMMRCLISIPRISRALSPPPAAYLTLRAQRSLATDTADTFSDGRMMQKKKKQQKSEEKKKAELLAVKRKKEKRRTRSEKEFGSTISFEFHSNENHIPVMLGEVVDVFSSVCLRSFVDCTLGAAGHSSAVSTFSLKPDNKIFILLCTNLWVMFLILKCQLTDNPGSS